MKPTGPATVKELAKMLDYIKESERLKKLTDEQLVAECAKLNDADSQVVEEMMTRLDPHWADEKTPKQD